MSKPNLTTINLDQTFNPKDLTFSDWCDAEKCGDLVKNPRMAIGHKSMKTKPSPIPNQGKYRSQDSFFYFVGKGSAIGIFHSYPPKMDRKPENMKGYDLVLALLDDRDRLDPDPKKDTLYWALDGFHKQCVKELCKKKDQLPGKLRKMTDEQIAKAVYPPFTPKRTDKAGVERAPTFNVPFKYYKAKDGKPESLQTKCKGPNNQPFHPKDYLSVPKVKCISGKATFAIRVCHLSYSTNVDKKTGEIKLTFNYGLELSNINFTPNSKFGEPDILGDNNDEFEAEVGDETKADDEIYNKDNLKDVDVDDEKDEKFGDQDSPKKSKSKSKDETPESPKKSKKSKETPESPKKKSKKSKEESPQESPKKSKKSKFDSDDEDEPKKKRK